MRQHQWNEPFSISASYLWEERVCKICGLKDRRYKTAGASWEIRTPCIEPVPDLVRFEDLMEELRAHEVRETPMAIGHPGNWQIGFALLRQKNLNRHGTCPKIPITGDDTLEHGWAQLLRWIRARQYSVSKYSDFSGQYEWHNRQDLNDDDD